MKTTNWDEREVDTKLDDNLMVSFGQDILENELKMANLMETWCSECQGMKAHALVEEPSRHLVCAECHHAQEQVKSVVGKPIKGLLLPGETSNEAGLHAAWERLTQTVEEGAIKAYSIRARLDEGDVIKHKVFGLGVVLSLFESKKAEVLFPDKTRRLVCGK